MVKFPLPKIASFTTLLGLALVTLLSAGSSVAADGRLYDPMRPQGQAATVAEQTPAAQEMRLESIVFADDRRSAVVNGQNIVEGDKLEGYCVKTISADAVVLSQAGNNKRLTLHADEKGKMHVSSVAKSKQ